LTSRRTGWLLAVLLAGMVMANLDIAVVNVAAPAIHAELGASSGELQLVVSGYTLSYAVLLVTGARLGAVRGQRACSWPVSSCSPWPRSAAGWLLARPC
jgi:MFS family permease